MFAKAICKLFYVFFSNRGRLIRTNTICSMDLFVQRKGRGFRYCVFVGDLDLVVTLTIVGQERSPNEWDSARWKAHKTVLWVFDDTCRGCWSVCLGAGDSSCSKLFKVIHRGHSGTPIPQPAQFLPHDSHVHVLCPPANSCPPKRQRAPGTAWVTVSGIPFSMTQDL